tara:strand:+ start:177 stop:1082 length:906 start_codon:yes stop_codon:yes gene_type:complete
MKILDVPQEFQPIYKSNYPGYSSGRNMEEIFYEMFKKNNEEMDIERIYIPVFWTSYYVTHNYANNIQPIYNWLDTLDKTKKYFTIVQYASGIFIKNKDYNLDLMVFSAGGGGLNVKGPTSEKQLKYNGLTRYIFNGDKGDCDLPLMCLPLFPSINIKKDIFCSFMGRFDTHYCRINMYNVLHKNEKFKLFKSVNFEKYKEILNRSIFTLAPRGYGYTSFRIYEAIMANSIPIYIWHDKKILPFSDTINWENFCIIIHDDDIEKLPEILEKCDIKQMQNELHKVKTRFTFNETFKYISKKIQ